MSAVIFDMDGVLLDTERLIIESWKKVAERYGIGEIEETCVSCLGTTKEVTTEIFMKRYGADFPYPDYENEMKELFFAHFREQGVPVKEGAGEILRRLSEQHIPAALASSTRSGLVHKELQDAGLARYFTEFICGDMVTESKPSPEIFLKAAAALHEEPGRCFVIEDSFNGVRAGHAAGMHVIMVPDILQPTEEIRALAERVLPSLETAWDYLKERLDLQETNKTPAL